MQRKQNNQSERHNSTGYLVPPNNPEQLAEKIINMVCEPTLREKMGEYGYRKVKSMCDLKEYGERMNSVYESIL